MQAGLLHLEASWEASQKLHSYAEPNERGHAAVLHRWGEADAGGEKGTTQEVGGRERRAHEAHRNAQRRRQEGEIRWKDTARLHEVQLRLWLGVPLFVIALMLMSTWFQTDNGGKEGDDAANHAVVLALASSIC